MRSFLLASIAALAFPACSQDIGSGGGGDDTQDAVCGDHVIGTGETCDDGNTTPGDGCDASCQVEQSTTGHVALSVDPVTTELGAITTFSVTVTASDGYSGMVTLAGAVADSGGTAVTEWAVAFATNTVAVPMNGTATAMGTITTKSTALPSMANNLKIDATSTVDPASATVAVTALDQITFNLKVDNTGVCAYDAAYGTLAAPVHVSVGTKVRFFNTSTVNLVVHSDGGADGISHQGQGPSGTADPTTEPQTAYEQTLSTLGNGNAFGWYCHVTGPDMGNNNPHIQPDPAP